MWVFHFYPPNSLPHSTRGEWVYGCLGLSCSLRLNHDTISNNNNKPNYLNIFIFRFQELDSHFLPQVVYYHHCEAVIKLIIHKLAIKYLFRWTALRYERSPTEPAPLKFWVRHHWKCWLLWTHKGRRKNETEIHIYLFLKRKRSIADFHYLHKKTTTSSFPLKPVPIPCISNSI